MFTCYQEYGLITGIDQFGPEFLYRTFSFYDFLCNTHFFSFLLSAFIRSCFHSTGSPNGRPRLLRLLLFALISTNCRDEKFMPCCSHSFNSFSLLINRAEG